MSNSHWNSVAPGNRNIKQLCLPRCNSKPSCGWPCSEMYSGLAHKIRGQSAILRILRFESVGCPKKMQYLNLQLLNPLCDHLIAIEYQLMDTAL